MEDICEFHMMNSTDHVAVEVEMKGYVAEVPYGKHKGNGTCRNNSAVDQDTDDEHICRTLNDELVEALELDLSLSLQM